MYAQNGKEESQPLLDEGTGPKGKQEQTLEQRLAKSGWLRVVLAFVVSGAWMFVSSLLIILNKYIMVDLKFRYPMAVSGMGMAMSGVLGFICCRVFRLVEGKAVIKFNFWTRKILPVGLFMALTLWTGNQVYLYLTVAFIQMLKAFTPVVTMVCLFIARLEDPSRDMILSVLLTAAGTAVAAYGEVNMSIVGIIFMFSSETAESIRLVMTQFLLVGLKFHPIEGLMYLAPACCLWLILGGSLLELRPMLRENAVAIIYDNPWTFVAAAVMGFMVNTLAYTTIKLASSLTLKVLGTVKNTLLVIFGVLFLGEIVTGIQGLGYLVSLSGFAWYNFIKINQIAAGAGASPADKPTDGSHKG